MSLEQRKNQVYDQDLNPLDVVCPLCGAPAGEVCVKMETQRLGKRDPEKYHMAPLGTPKSDMSRMHKARKLHVKTVWLLSDGD